MTSLKPLLFLAILGIASPVHAAPKARHHSVKRVIKKRSVRPSPTQAKVRFSPKLLVKKSGSAAVVNARLLRSIQRSQKIANENFAGVHRDLRYRAPHQAAIMKSVKSVLSGASKRVRLGESTQLTTTLNALRSHRNKAASHLAGEGDPRQVQIEFQKMQTLLQAVFSAAQLPKLPLFSPLDR